MVDPGRLTQYFVQKSQQTNKKFRHVKSQESEFFSYNAVEILSIANVSSVHIRTCSLQLATQYSLSQHQTTSAFNACPMWILENYLTQ